MPDDVVIEETKGKTRPFRAWLSRTTTWAPATLVEPPTDPPAAVQPGSCSLPITAENKPASRDLEPGYTFVMQIKVIQKNETHIAALNGVLDENDQDAFE